MLLHPTSNECCDGIKPSQSSLEDATGPYARFQSQGRVVQAHPPPGQKGVRVIEN